MKAVPLAIFVLLPESVQLDLAKYQKLDLRAEGPQSSDARQTPGSYSTVCGSGVGLPRKSGVS